jgi:excinuclease UvrABC helicase subunit UvrB
VKEQIKQFYLNSSNVKKLADALDKEEHISCLGLIGSARSYVVASSADIIGGTSFVICSDKERAAYFYNDIENIVGEKDVD